MGFISNYSYINSIDLFFLSPGTVASLVKTFFIWPSLMYMCVLGLQTQIYFRSQIVCDEI